MNSQDTNTVDASTSSTPPTSSTASTSISAPVTGSKRAKKWTNAETEVLLKLLESGYDVVWNLQHPDYCNRAVAENAKSRLIADLTERNVHRTVDSVITRIKSIRDTVTKIIRLRTKGGTGSAGGGKVNIPVWYSLATFMEESVLARDSQETMDFTDMDSVEVEIDSMSRGTQETIPSSTSSSTNSDPVTPIQPAVESRQSYFNVPRNRNPKRAASETVTALKSAMEVLQKERMLRQKLNPRKTAFLDYLAAIIAPMDDRTYRDLEYELKHTLEAFERAQAEPPENDDLVYEFEVVPTE